MDCCDRQPRFLFLAFQFREDIQDKIFIGVDHDGVLVGREAVKSALVAPVDVAVDKIAGMIALHEPQEDIEAHMGQIRAVVQLPGRRMGQKHVEALLPPEAWQETAHPAGHTASVY